MNPSKPLRDDQISVVHSKAEDSPRAETDQEEDDAAPADRDLELKDAEKDESIDWETDPPLRRPALTDAPADISPLREVGEGEIGAAFYSDQATLADYEKKDSA